MFVTRCFFISAFLVVLVGNLRAGAENCSADQMNKMQKRGFSKVEIAKLCQDNHACTPDQLEKMIDGGYSKRLITNLLCKETKTNTQITDRGVAPAPKAENPDRSENCTAGQIKKMRKKGFSEGEIKKYCGDNQFCTPDQLEKMIDGGYSKRLITNLLCKETKTKTQITDKVVAPAKPESDTKPEIKAKPQKPSKPDYLTNAGQSYRTKRHEKPTKQNLPDESVKTAEKSIPAAVEAASYLKNPYMFHKGEVSLGAEYISYANAGGGVKASYFLFDDFAVEAEFETLPGYGGSSLTMGDIGGAYHLLLVHTGRELNFGLYAGVGYAYGKWSSSTSSLNSSGQLVTVSASQDLSNVYWKLCFETRFNSYLSAHAGYMNHIFPGGAINGGGALFGLDLSF